MSDTSHVIAHLDDVLKEYQGLKSKSTYSDLSGNTLEDASQFVTRARAAIRRAAGQRSAYFDQCEEILRRDDNVYLKAMLLVGVVSSLRADVAAGYLISQRELIHGELFADFLEMAQHLLDEHFKDAAAVIAGSSLEAHLRQLCLKAGLSTEFTVGSGTKPKRADALNNDLKAAGAITLLDQKNVTAWLDLRNKAAHGHYSEYADSQVGILISSIRDFISRYPA